MTSLQRALEARHGRPLRDILIDALHTTRQVRTAALHLDISHKTFYRWADQTNVHPADEILKARASEAA